MDDKSQELAGQLQTPRICPSCGGKTKIIAEAIVDRLVNSSLKIQLKGGSYRERLPKNSTNKLPSKS